MQLPTACAMCNGAVNACSSQGSSVRETNASMCKRLQSAMWYSCGMRPASIGFTCIARNRHHRSSATWATARSGPAAAA